MGVLADLRSDVAAELRTTVRWAARSFFTAAAFILASALGIEGWLNYTDTGQKVDQTLTVVSEISVTVHQEQGGLPQLIERIQTWLDQEGVAR